mgnify:CR=1 FL=1
MKHCSTGAIRTNSTSCSRPKPLPQYALLDYCHADVQPIAGLSEECTPGIVVDLYVNLQQQEQQQWQQHMVANISSHLWWIRRLHACGSRWNVAYEIR